MENLSNENLLAIRKEKEKLSNDINNEKDKIELVNNVFQFFKLFSKLIMHINNQKMIKNYYMILNIILEN